MKKTNLSWGVSITFPGYGGNVDKPDWSLVQDKLRTVVSRKGTVTLDTLNENRNRSLQVRACSGKYLVTLGVETEEDWVVRGYVNPENPLGNEMVDVSGDYWVSRSICMDKGLVKRIFQDFFTTDDVSKRYSS
ncbi:MAG: DUF6911 family protein [Janthinobacterium lividum]